MSADLISVRKKKVPTLYEEDESKYVGPHKWQIHGWARLARRALRWYAYDRHADAAFTEVKVVGAEHLRELTGPLVIVGNHTSHLDTLLTQRALPEAVKSRLYYGAAQDRWFVKGKKKLVLKPWYQSLALGTFPILRGGGKRALSYAKWLLQRGQNVFLFPEGTRATSDGLGEFKHGATILALQTGATIVPVYLEGLRALRPKGQREVMRGAATLHVLPPMYFAANTDVKTATDAVRAAMCAVHAQCTQAQAQDRDSKAA